jgi:putative alpha-1,2-mannosidase
VQLQALFDPKREGDMMQSLVNDAVQSGWFPRWPAANDVTYVMGGDSPAVLLASSYAFGAHNFDVDTALKYMVKAEPNPASDHTADPSVHFWRITENLATCPWRKTTARPSAPLNTQPATLPSHNSPGK